MTPAGLTLDTNTFRPTPFPQAGHSDRRRMMAAVWLSLALCTPGRGGVAENLAWSKVNSSLKVNRDVVPDADVFTFDDGDAAMVAIQTGPISDRSGVFVQRGAASGVNVARFTVEDTVARAKARAEATSCFATQATIAEAGLSPSEVAMASALSFVAQNCSGAWSSGDAAVPGQTLVSYDLMLPKGLSPNASFIAGQFHGRPDPRIFFDPGTNATKRLTTADAFVACGGTLGQPAANSWRCEDGNITGGKYAGWLYKQGGYPPLTFGLAGAKDGDSPMWWVQARSDDRLFVPKGDCGFSPLASRSYWPDGRVCPGGSHERVTGLWRAPFASIPLGVWLNFEWRVRWSSYATAGGALLRNGTVGLTISAGRSSPLVNVQWEGPVGRHDDGRSPYFKVGIYDPSGSTAAESATFRRVRIETGPAGPVAGAASFGTNGADLSREHV